MELGIQTGVLILFMLIACLYAMVGHGGASAYLALFALLAYPLTEARAMALILNILVSFLVMSRLYFHGLFNFRLLFTLVVFSVPAAYFGGYWSKSFFCLPYFLGFLLVISAFLLLQRFRNTDDYEIKTPGIFPLVLSGSVLGLVSGISGIGGGVFLSPLLLLFHWEKPRVVSFVSAGFIFFNSLAGITGSGIPSGLNLNYLLILACFVLAGAWIGNKVSVVVSKDRTIVIVLSGLLFLAALKMVFS